jgi:histidinol-phosphate aminotransferase
MPANVQCRIDLSDNTNLFGSPPSALAVLRGDSVPALARYPTAYADDLKLAIADYTGVEAENVVTGCGSDDVLDSIIRAFCESHELVATSAPSFAMIPLLTAINGLAAREIDLLEDLNVDAGGLLAQRAAVTYLCSPNNPTGTVVSRSSLLRILSEAAGVVVLDEAYFEFASDPPVIAIGEADNLVRVRTLSKAVGLAGLRVGYAIGPRDLVTEIEKARGPFKVSSLAERAAAAALRSDTQWISEKAQEAAEERRRFSAELLGYGLAPIPSEANFVLVPVADAAGIAVKLRESGVLVRDFSRLPVVGDALRITVGPRATMEEAARALKHAIA